MSWKVGESQQRNLKSKITFSKLSSRYTCSMQFWEEFRKWASYTARKNRTHRVLVALWFLSQIHPVFLQKIYFVVVLKGCSLSFWWSSRYEASLCERALAHFQQVIRLFSERWAFLIGMANLLKANFRLALCCKSAKSCLWELYQPTRILDLAE